MGLLCSSPVEPLLILRSGYVADNWEESFSSNCPSPFLLDTFTLTFLCFRRSYVYSDDFVGCFSVLNVPSSTKTSWFLMLYSSPRLSSSMFVSLSIVKFFILFALYFWCVLCSKERKSLCQMIVPSYCWHFVKLMVEVFLVVFSFCWLGMDNISLPSD